MKVRECMGLIVPSNHFIMKDVDGIAPDQEFAGIDQFRMSELYNNIADYEIYGVESKDSKLVITYGDNAKDIRLNMNSTSAVLLKNILKDSLEQLPNNNVNKDNRQIVENLIEKLEDELFIIFEDEE